VKLLSDENLSRYLVDPLSRRCEEVQHVVLCGLKNASDQSIWDYALQHGLIVVTKDADFAELSILRGHPPKVVWLKSGNGPKHDVERILGKAFSRIESVAKDQVESCLVLGPEPIP
jgi:predicted nuclease of predicted toxin-antitoxin system